MTMKRAQTRRERECTQHLSILSSTAQLERTHAELAERPFLLFSSLPRSLPLSLPLMSDDGEFYVHDRRWSGRVSLFFSLCSCTHVKIRTKETVYYDHYNIVK